MQIILEAIFNQLLGDPHRALRPKGVISQQQNIICCVYDFTLKQQIMAKARAQHIIEYEGSTIQLYPDLPWLTLQKRRYLKPLLQLLKDDNFSYRWGFPFALFSLHKWLYYDTPHIGQIILLWQGPEYSGSGEHRLGTGVSSSGPLTRMAKSQEPETPQWLSTVCLPSHSGESTLSFWNLIGFTVLEVCCLFAFILTSLGTLKFVL